MKRPNGNGQASYSRARERKTYRAWLRNNAMKWQGVKPTKTIEHPPLVKVVSKRGEVSYTELWD